MKMPRRPRRGPASRGGFTLAEAAVTIAIMAMVLLMVVQGLQGAEQAAYYTKMKKTSYELAVGLLGEVQAGLYREELDDGMNGNFADLDYPDITWEIALGDEVFAGDDDQDRPFDNLAARRQREQEREDEESSGIGSEEEDDEELEEPFEKIKVRVTFPVRDEDYDNETILESWVPWEQVYGPSEEEEAAEGAPGDGGETGGGEGTGDR